MIRYTVNISHSLIYSVEIDANSSEEAKSLAVNMYDKGEVAAFDTTYDEFDFVEAEEM